MASTTLNLVEAFPVSDVLTKITAPNRYTENFVDGLLVDDTITELLLTVRTLLLTESLGISDTLVKTHTNRYTENLVDGLAIGEVVEVTKQSIFIFNLEDTIIPSDDLDESHTIQTVISLDEVLAIVDNVSVSSTDRVDFDFVESFPLVDFITIRGTNRTVRNPVDNLLLTDILVQEYGIRMIPHQGGVGFINGVSFLSLQAGTIAILTVSIPFNNIFYKWIFNKSGIANIYKPETTITVPAGGGAIRPSFISLGVIEVPIGSIVIFVDPNDLEYVDHVDGDYISTTEKVEAVGDAVSVAIKNLTIEQGSTFYNIVIYRDENGDPVDLTGYTAEMQIRKTKDSSVILLTLNTSNGYLILGGVNGTIIINVPADITNSLDFIWGKYDLELYPFGVTSEAIRLLEGKINLSKQVTQ